MGFSASLLHYGLMGLVAVVCVASFESVGSVLVIAMMIVPPATAHLLTDRLLRLLILSSVVCIVASVSGYWTATYWNTSVAGIKFPVQRGKAAFPFSHCCWLLGTGCWPELGTASA